MPLFENVWHTQPDAHDADHARSLLEQFEDCADQPHEHLYYGPVIGTSLPRVSNLYNMVTAQSKEHSFRLEGAPQPKLIYQSTMTDEDIANLRDPSIKPEILSATSSRDAPDVPESGPPRRALERELSALVKSSHVCELRESPI